MLGFTTTTIINSADDFNVITKAGATAAALAVGNKLVVKGGPELKYDGELGGISGIYVNKASKAEFAQAEVKFNATAGNVLTAETSDVFRIELYVRLSGSNESTFANDWVFKGKPMSLGEFPGKTTVAQVVNLVKRHQLALYGDEIFKVEAKDANTLLITAKTQYMRFVNQSGEPSVVLQKFTPDSDASGTNPNGVLGHFETVADATTIVCSGKEAFGDFGHITKDLRLPSDVNTRWYGVANGDILNGEGNPDRANPGFYYTQITIVYDHNRGLGNQSIAGGLGRSRSTHVFYVYDDEPADGVDADGADVAGIASTFLTKLGFVANTALTTAATPGVRENVVVPTTK